MTTSTRSVRPARRLGLRAGLALAGLTAVAGLAVAGQAAPTAGAATSTPFGTATLMQGNDIGSVKDNVGELDLQQTYLYGARTVSRCTGDASFDTLGGDKTLTSLSSSWSNADGASDGRVTEAIAQASTPAAAKKAAVRVLAALQTCQHEPRGHWHYGQLYHGPLTDRDHVWMDTIDGQGRVTGGIGVMLQGSRFGVVEVSSATGDGDDAIKNVIIPAENRLAG